MPIINQRMPIDFDFPSDGALQETAAQLLQEIASGIDYGDTTSDRITRLERMVCLLVLQHAT